MKLVVGLGNPGKKYERTRHNIGFLVLDALHEQLKHNSISSWEKNKKFQSLICGATINNEKILFVKPQTFMNESGRAVRSILEYYHILPKDVIVVHDDKDIFLGEIKIQSDRGSAGHNGIKSIITHLGTQNFTRVRIGIRSENEKKMQDVPKFVLGKFGLFEKSSVKKVIEEAGQNVRDLL